MPKIAENKTLKERLRDKGSTFTRDEIYALFEELCEEYGFHRDPNLPSPSTAVETTSLVLDGYPDLPVIVVRPRTNRDLLITIPSLVDKILGPNLQPSNYTLANAYAVATAQTVIVSPPGLVEQILSSDRPGDARFFADFSREYEAWLQSRVEEASKKKSGPTPGNEPVSTSAPTTGSLPLVPNGLL